MHRLFELLPYRFATSPLLHAYHRPAVWVTSLLGVAAVVLSFPLRGDWATLAGNAGVTLLLVPPLVAVQLVMEKVIQLQPKDVEGLPEVAQEALRWRDTIPARKAADFYRTDLVTRAQEWLGSAEQGVLLSTHTSAKFRLCLAQYLLLTDRPGVPRGGHLSASPGPRPACASIRRDWREVP